MNAECMKRGSTMYFEARKAAAKYNEKLSSREGAAEVLAVSPRQLANYELGIAPVPVDVVVLMADAYNAPDLRNMHCKQECPIGKYLNIATDTEGIQSATLKILDGVNSVRELTDELIGIAADGVVDEEERKRLAVMMRAMDKLSVAMSELKIAAHKLDRKER